MTRILIGSTVIFALAAPQALGAQRPCPPDDPHPRSLTERFVLDPMFAPALVDAGAEDLKVEEIQVLETVEDGGICDQLKGWAEELLSGVDVDPAVQWTFYRARDRFVAVHWLPEAELKSRIRHTQAHYAWILDEDLNILVAAKM